ncbi:MAG TPA: nuclear transport factor 2 family protein [Terriglobia bacterium]|nr:nuclear transport factor 2 family protein [Terriglobia bacterium]
MSQHPEVPHLALLEGSKAGDIDLLVSTFTDDAVMMPPNDTTLYGKEEIRAWWAEYFQWFQVGSYVETDHDVTVAGEQAFQRMSLSIIIVPKRRGARIRDEIRTLTVWRFDDGAWKVSHHMWNSTNPVGSGTTRYLNKIQQRKNT